MEIKSRGLKLELTYQKFEELIITALEGGSNYWYLINSEDYPTKEENPEPPSVRIAQKVWNDEAYKLPIYDLENEDEILGHLNILTFLENITKGEGQWALEQLLSDHVDGEGADVLFQLGVMGEITFG